MLFIRSLIFSVGMIASTVVIGPLVILAFPLSFERRYGITTWWTRFNLWWLKVTCGVDCEVSGFENLPKGAAVVLSKHQSTWETLFLNCTLPALTWVIKRELLRVPFFGWALAQLEPIAIDRGSTREAAAQIIDQGKRFLDQGRWVLLFPEGTRTPPGKRQRYRLGGARLAANTGYPVLPIAHNAGEHWPRRGFLKTPGTIKVVFGPVIDSKDRNAEEINRLTETWIESTMQTISQVGSSDAAPGAPAPAHIERS